MIDPRCGSRMSGKGVHMYNGMGVCLADFVFYLIFLKYSMKIK